MYDAEVGKRLNSNNRQMFRQPIITSQDYALVFLKKGLHYDNLQKFLLGQKVECKIVYKMWFKKKMWLKLCIPSLKKQKTTWALRGKMNKNQDDLFYGNMQHIF